MWLDRNPRPGKTVRDRGLPELLVEVTGSVRTKVFRRRLDAYDRAGVREFLVATADPRDLALYARQGNCLEQVSLSGDGLLRSAVFPGLWLDAAALFADDLNEIIASLDRGLSSVEHADFQAFLAR